MSAPHPIPRPVLSVQQLKIELHGGAQTLVHDLSFDVHPGEFLAVVGESGSGKTMAARAILQLLPPGIAQTGGRIVFDGEDLGTRDAKAMRPIRGPGIGMVFQEPMVSLNPVHRIGEQMAEGLRMHTKLSAAEIRSRIVDMLSEERLPRICETRCGRLVVGRLSFETCAVSLEEPFTLAMIGTAQAFVARRPVRSRASSPLACSMLGEK